MNTRSVSTNPPTASRKARIHPAIVLLSTVPQLAVDSFRVARFELGRVEVLEQLRHPQLALRVLGNHCVHRHPTLTSMMQPVEQIGRQRNDQVVRATSAACSSLISMEFSCTR